jgi:hypothetical protein
MDYAAASADQCIENRAEQTGGAVKQESFVGSFSNLSDDALLNDQTLPCFGTDPISNWMYRHRGWHNVTKIADTSDIPDRSDFHPYKLWL